MEPLSLTAADIAAATAGEVVRGSPRADIGRIGIDSRTIAAGECFVAIRGERFDGHDFVAEVVARGAGHPQLRNPGPYDLIFANILARPLRQLAPDLARLSDFGGEIVLSGLIARDVAGVLSAYAAQGFALKRRLDIEGWATLLVSRSGAAPRPI